MEPYARQNLIDLLNDIESQNRAAFLWPWYHQVIRALVQDAGGACPAWATLKPRIATALKISGKIPAIKVYRSATGCGLREAKEVVEALMGAPLSAWDTIVTDFYSPQRIMSGATIKGRLGQYIPIFKMPGSKENPQKDIPCVRAKKPRLRHRQSPKSKKRVIGRAKGGGPLLNKGKK